MSGLGDRKKLNSKNIDERYAAICQAASSRSLLSLGLSCFQLRRKKNMNKIRLKCVTFNILTFCSKDFVVEPKSLEFLIKHGFDFNLQYGKGVAYYPGPDDKSKSKRDSSNFCLRRLFMEIVSARKPLILHNSLVDLVFLYENLYGPTPQTIHTFVSDLAQLFSAGIYDTKYVADYYLHTTASYLEYIFRKCLRENSFCQSSMDRCLSVRFKKFAHFAYDHVVYANCPDPKTKAQNKENNAVNVCPQFALHGFCPKEKCAESHDVDDILDWEEAKIEKKRAKRRRRRDNQKDSAVNSSNEGLNSETGNNDDCEVKLKNSSKTVKKSKLAEDELEISRRNLLKLFNEKIAMDLQMVNETEKVNGAMTKSERKKIKVDKRRKQTPEEICSNVVALTNEEHCIVESTKNVSENVTVCRCQRTFSGVHRAGFDAFMTGYALIFFSMKFAGWTGEEDDEFFVEEFKNKISLSGKDYPLLIQSSVFAKTSAYHDEKFRNLTF